MRSTLLLDNQATHELRIRRSFDDVLDHGRFCARCGVLQDLPRCGSGLRLFRAWRVDVDRGAAAASLRRRELAPRWGRGVSVEIASEVDAARRDLTYARPGCSIAWKSSSVQARRRSHW